MSLSHLFTELRRAMTPEDLGNKGIAERVDTIAHHTFTKERQPQKMSELSYHQPIQLF